MKNLFNKLVRKEENKSTNVNIEENYNPLLKQFKEFSGANSAIWLTTLENSMMANIPITYKCIGEENAVNQVNQEIKRLFENLCNYLDKELLELGLSLKIILNKVDKEKYYSNLLYILYYLSEKTVINNKTNENLNYIYKLLILYFINIKELEMNEKQDIISKIFNFSKQSKRLDINMDLSLSNNYSIVNLEHPVNIENFVENKPLISIQILEEKRVELSLEFWEYVMGNIKNYNLSKEVKLHLQLLQHGQFSYYVKDNYGFIEYLATKAANSLTMEYMNKNNKEINSLPGDFILNFQVFESKLSELANSYMNNISRKDLKFIYYSIIHYCPYNEYVIANYILIYNDEFQIELIKEFFYEYESSFVKIARELMNNINDKDLKFFLLFLIDKLDSLNKDEIKQLKKMYHPENQVNYENLKLINKNISFEDLMKLKDKPRKKIELNPLIIEDSRKSLSHTVNLIDNFIDDGEKEQPNNHKGLINIVENFETKNISSPHLENIQKYIPVDQANQLTEDVQITKENSKISQITLDILDELLENNSISTQRISEIAKSTGKLTNSFIADMNKELYYLVEDQIIITEENFIRIDEFYVDIVKEMRN